MEASEALTISISISVAIWAQASLARSRSCSGLWGTLILKVPFGVSMPIAAGGAGSTLIGFPVFSARSATEKKRAIETPSLDYVPVCHAAGECLLNVILICMVAWRCGRWTSCVAVVGRTSVRANVASRGGLNQGGFAPPIITAVGTCRFWTEGSPAEAILYTVSRVWIWIGMPW